MNHDRLDAPVAQIGAMGHRNGEILVRADHQLGEIQSRLLLASVRLDDGGEVGARVHEQSAHAAILQHAQVSLGDRGHRPVLVDSHSFTPLPEVGPGRRSSGRR